MKQTELKRLIALCKKSGIKSIKMGDISLEFDSKFNIPNQKELLNAFIPTKGEVPTEDDFLYWSTDNPEIEDEKKN